MTDSSYEFREVRFIYEPELTQCYVLLQAFGDSPIGIQGWHHKTFPAAKSAVDILIHHAADAVLWPQDAQP